MEWITRALGSFEERVEQVPVLPADGIFAIRRERTHRSHQRIRQSGGAALQVEHEAGALVRGGEQRGKLQAGQPASLQVPVVDQHR
jgi:hypothetical protein